MSDYRSVIATIERLYAAALELSDLTAFLGVLAPVFDADNAYLSKIDTTRGELKHILLRPACGVKVPPYASLLDDDPRMPVFRNSRLRPIHCRTAVSQSALYASQTYREYLRPLGIEYTLIVGLPDCDSSTNYLGLTRGKSGKPFDADDCDRLSEFVPHLARGFAIRRALEEKRSTPALIPAPRPARTAESEQDALQRLFGLPPAQSRLAVLLASGRSVKDIAGDLNITHGSARQYLKRIYKKTGTRRQTDLVRLAVHALMQR